MSDDKSRAAKIADCFERPGYDAQKECDTTAAAAELRRLDAVNRELLEALRLADEMFELEGFHTSGHTRSAIFKAIAKATDV